MDVSWRRGIGAALPSIAARCRACEHGWRDWNPLRNRSWPPRRLCREHPRRRCARRQIPDVRCDTRPPQRALDRPAAVPHTGTMRPALRRMGIFVCVLGVAPHVLQGVEPPPRATRFATAIEQLSEPGGYFDTDNLISNEKSYLDVLPALAAHGVSGGVYVGVGPDLNFSYIARVRPTAAYIIDIRRDNLLLHLLFKAIFAEARTRAEYLSLLTGRAPPIGLTNAPLDELVQHIDRTTSSRADIDQLRARLDRAIVGFGVPLSRQELASIDRFHRTFVTEGLDLVFESHGRPRSWAAGSRYPNFRELLLSTDAQGRKRNFLASEDDFQFLKALQARDAIIPVVGDVAGPTALKGIAAAVVERRERVSAFYISNVEFYLARDGRYARYLENLSHLPHDSRSVLIRSVFGGGSSMSMVESIDDT